MLWENNSPGQRLLRDYVSASENMSPNTQLATPVKDKSKQMSISEQDEISLTDEKIY